MMHWYMKKPIGKRKLEGFVCGAQNGLNAYKKAMTHT